MTNPNLERSWTKLEVRQRAKSAARGRSKGFSSQAQNSFRSVGCGRCEGVGGRSKCVCQNSPGPSSLSILSGRAPRLSPLFFAFHLRSFFLPLPVGGTSNDSWLLSVGMLDGWMDGRARRGAGGQGNRRMQLLKRVRGWHAGHLRGAMESWPDRLCSECCFLDCVFKYREVKNGLYRVGQICSCSG